MDNKKTIAIIGGGQLGLMIAQEAHDLGAEVAVLDPSPDAPAFAVADRHVVGAYDDIKALEELCEGSDVVTYEFENVPGDVLRHIEGKYNIKQGVAPLFDSQDRLREKANARIHGLRTPDFIPVPALDFITPEEGEEPFPGNPEFPVPMSAEDVASLSRKERLSQLEKAVSVLGMPCVLKTRTLGYDGHGQAVIRENEDLEPASDLLKVPCILEKFVGFDYEASVVMVNDGDKIIHFPIGRNIHTGGILDLSIVPAPGLSDGLHESPAGAKISKACEDFMKSCGYKGILAVELFIKGDDFYFNEMAPRPHNSGHYTIEGCSTNQYRELCRFLLGQPLETPKLLAPTVMKNILGQDLEAAKAIVAESLEGAGPGVSVSSPDDVDDAFCGQAGKGVFVHLYGKSQSRPKRKMGHITFTPMTPEEFMSVWASRFV